MTSVLLVDDEPGVRVSLGIALRRAGFTVEEAASCAEARDRIETRSHDAVIADYKLGDGTGIDLLRWVRSQGSHTCFVLITGFGTIPLAVSAMRDGASHFLSKPVEPAALLSTLRELIRSHAPKADLPAWLIAKSPAMLACLQLARAAAASRATLLVTGRTGVGKEVVTRYIHECSSRRDAPYVAINCAAVSPALFESEFFGHVRGAFTGATEERAGVFREAHGGTLLLDEVLEIPTALQAKFLRSIETGEVRPVGASTPEHVDVRIIASTNMDPELAVREGRFREDLYYRLGAIRIDVARLAERPEDILPLAEHFLREQCGLYVKSIARFAPEAQQALVRHAWPGNVRELRNVVERAVVNCRGTQIGVADLALAPATPGAASSARDLDGLEREHILAVLGQCSNNKAEAARQLGISKSTLRRKLIQYGVAEQP